MTGDIPQKIKIGNSIFHAKQMDVDRGYAGDFTQITLSYTSGPTEIIFKIFEDSGNISKEIIKSLKAVGALKVKEKNAE